VPDKTLCDMIMLKVISNYVLLCNNHKNSNVTGHQFFDDFLPRDASAERDDVTVSRLSVRPSVRLSVTIRYHDHIVGILRK